MTPINLIWFRRDLRLEDNWMLYKACEKSGLCLPFFVIDPYFYSTWSETGVKRVQFLFQSLEILHKSLQKLDSNLVLLEGDSVKVVSDLMIYLAQKGYRPGLFWHRDIQIDYGTKRDREVESFLHKNGFESNLGDNNFFLSGQKDYTDWRLEYYKYQKTSLHPTPLKINTLNLDQITPRFPNLLDFGDLKQKYNQYFQDKSQLFKGGFEAGNKVLESFVNYRFEGYHWKLSRPYLATRGATSQLSPHIMWGTVSVRQANQKAYQRCQEFKSAGETKKEFSLKAFLERLRWRESFTHRLYQTPSYATTNWYAEFDDIYNWELNQEQQEYLQKWKSGMTGFPLVDASMRQLAKLGWLNFRMRAMVATFLTINCGIGWQHGAKHFMNCLVDGDIAINHWQWQMQAGITNPFASTFRIYNPTKTLQEKDPDLKFIHLWLPELKNFDMQQILNLDYLDRSNYPSQMLDFLATRKVNGQKVSDLREKVRKRLAIQNGYDIPKISPKKTRSDQNSISLFD